jgi:hypothetical protein
MADAHSNRLPESFSLAVPDEEAIQEGEAAAERLVSGQSLTDQLAVARALMVGRRAAMREAQTNQPAGKPYFMAFSRWLADHPKLKAVSGPERAAALWCVEPDNWPKVQEALAKLDDRSRQRATLRGLRKQIERSMPEPHTAQREPAQPKVDEGTLAKLQREIAELKAKAADLDKKLWDESRETIIVRGALGLATDENRRLKKALHEQTIEKLAEKLILRGQTKPTEQDVANAALGQGPKVERSKQPAFSAREINLLRKALHPDGKPEELQKMFTEASALFNDRADLLVKSAKRKRV